MFAKTIIDSDTFLDMPLSTQALYFHLSMRADDDGFINNPKKIQRIVGASDDDLKILIGKRFLIPFESGIVVIKHWRIHNYIQNDRYKETIYTEEKSQLTLKKNKSYTLDLSEVKCIQDVSKVDTKLKNNKVQEIQQNQGFDAMYTECIQNGDTGKARIGKDSIGKDSIGEYMPDVPSDTPTPKESKHKFGEYKHVLLKNTELESLNKDYGEQMTLDCIKFLDEYIEMKGAKYKSHYLAIRKWVVDAVKEQQRKAQPQKNQVNNKFNNYEHREYDYDAIEKQLLGNT